MDNVTNNNKENTMAFQMKERKGEIDTTDFTKLVDVLDTDEFSKKLWERLVEQTEILINEKDGLDINSVNHILANYAKHHSWLITEEQRYIAMLDKTELVFDEWYKSKYAQASREVPKNTAANIDAKIVEICKEEMEGMIKRYKREGLTDKEVVEKTKYQGWKGHKMYIIELKAKTNMIKGFVKVWDKEVNALQTLSKNITSEMDIVRRNLE